MPFAGPQVTWAGEWPQFPPHRLLGFAKEDGSIEVRDLEGIRQMTGGANEPLDAVNGVAFNRNMMAVSTPSKIIITKVATNDQQQSKAITHKGGAHGIVATKRGGFLAPAGVRGIVQFDEDAESCFRVRNSRPTDRDIYLYKLVSVGSTPTGEEFFACAGRSDCLLTFSIKPDGEVGVMGTTKGRPSSDPSEFDIVDVCPIPSPEHPFAVVSLGINNTLHFCQDIRSESPTVGLRLPEMLGTGYTLLHTEGHLFILTSEAFYLLPDLAKHLLNRESRAIKTVSYRTPVEALDCSLAYGKVVLLITQGNVLTFEIGDLTAGSLDNARKPTRTGEDGIFSEAVSFAYDPFEFTGESTRSPITTWDLQTMATH